MNNDELKKHVDAIENLIHQVQRDVAENEEIRNKKEQLRTVKRSIAQLERKRIPVPKEMQDLKLTLVTDLENGEAPLNGLQPVYERLLDIIEDLGRLCGRSPRRDLYLKARERKSRTTTAEALAPVLVEVLREMGGSAHQKDIALRVKQKLKGKLTEADFERPQGKTPRWQLALRRARKLLIEDGTLTPDSKGRTWTLTR